MDFSCTYLLNNGKCNHTLSLGTNLYHVKIKIRDKTQNCFVPYVHSTKTTDWSSFSINNQVYTTFFTLDFTCVRISYKYETWGLHYHSETTYDGTEQKDKVLLDFLSSFQQDVEEFHKTKGRQEEPQQLQKSKEEYNS